MRIVIDGRLWSQTGVGRYIRNLVFELQKIDRENEYFLLLLKKDFDRVELNKNFQKVLADFQWYGASEQLKLPGLLKDLNPDLVHFPHFNVPLRYKGRYIVTIHDLIHHHFQFKRATTHNPLFYKVKTFGYNQVFGHAVKNAAMILTPSKFVKDQLVNEYKIDSKKITVTYEAADDALINLVKQDKASNFQKVAAKFKITKPYFYYVGNAHPHKNLSFLIKGFEEIRKEHPEYMLVLSGPDHYFWQQLKKEHKTEGVVVTGFVTDKEMVTLYKNAESFVTPSLEEGFGIPLLEAMACGTPVVTSNAASLPEVGGKAVLYFDPKDRDDLKRQMKKIITGKKLREELVKKGKARYKEFSWKELARQTFEGYQKA